MVKFLVLESHCPVSPRHLGPGGMDYIFPAWLTGKPEVNGDHGNHGVDDRTCSNVFHPNYITQLLKSSQLIISYQFIQIKFLFQPITLPKSTHKSNWQVQYHNIVVLIPHEINIHLKINVYIVFIYNFKSVDHDKHIYLMHFVDQAYEGYVPIPDCSFSFFM